MIGAILGDIAGSRYEFAQNRKVPSRLWTKDDFFTDDTVLTLATLKALNEFKSKRMTKEEFSRVYAFMLRQAVENNPSLSYGGGFMRWVFSMPTTKDVLTDADMEEWLEGLQFSPNASYGNGAAMKVSPAAYVASSMDEAKRLAELVTRVTHNTQEGVKAAEAVSTSIYAALHGATKEEIEENAAMYYPSVRDMSYEELRRSYRYTELAEDTTPQAIRCFLDSGSFVGAIKMAVSIGGDADTLAAITGSIAEAFYGYTVDEEQGLWQGDSLSATVYELNRFTEGQFRHELDMAFKLERPYMRAKLQR